MSEPAAMLSPVFRCQMSVDETSLPRLRQMGADGRISSDHMLVRNGRASMVLTGAEITLLEEMGFEIEVGPELREQARRVQTEVAALGPSAESGGLRAGFVNQYLDVDGIHGRFQALHAEFPGMTECADLPHRTTGYDGSKVSLRGPAAVKLFRITTAPTDRSKPGVLLIAGTHAREWIPPLAAIEFAEQLLRNFDPGSANLIVQANNDLVEGLDILIAPAINPDGINFSHHDDPMWRKNRRPRPSSASPACGGVDNNRNYAAFWGEAGSSGDPCSDSYRGPAALSEAENRNVLHILEQFPNILTAVDCHSFGEDIFRPHPTGGMFVPSQPVDARDHEIYLSLEAAINGAIGAVSPGKTYSTGTTNNHAGTCDDYLFVAHRIYGFTLECAEEFQPPIAQALIAVREMSAALRALAGQTLSLASRFTTPAHLVVVIDGSQSMATAGSTERARSIARQLIDLMSLNDRIGIMSFNESATTHLGMTSIANPGMFTTARTVLEPMAFGGGASIGAGLQAAADLLNDTAEPRGIVLVSDGRQDRPSRVSDVLPTLPAGTKVFTIALGAGNDEALLRGIATATGGRHHFRPNQVMLLEIYNSVRSGMTEET